MPVPPTSRYFHVASKARGVPLKCSSGTAASVTASVAIHSRPRCRAWCAGAHQPSTASKRGHEHAVRPLGAHPQVRHAVGRADQEQQRHRRQHRPRQRIEAQPRIGRDRRADASSSHSASAACTSPAAGSSQGRVRSLGQSGREHRRRQGHDDEEQFVHSRSTVSLRVSSESNARWMRSTMMPMTNTATVRSSRMPPPPSAAWPGSAAGRTGRCRSPGSGSRRPARWPWCGRSAAASRSAPRPTRPAPAASRRAPAAAAARRASATAPIVAAAPSSSDGHEADQRLHFAVDVGRAHRPAQQARESPSP